MVGLGFQAETLKQKQRSEALQPDINDGATSSSSSSIKSPAQQHAQLFASHVRAVRIWSQEYIAFSTPLIANALVSPAAALLDIGDLLVSGDTERVLSTLDGKLLEMVLKRFAEYWGIGLFCLGWFPTVCQRIHSCRHLTLCKRHAGSSPVSRTYQSDNIQKAGTDVGSKYDATSQVYAIIPAGMHALNAMFHESNNNGPFWRGITIHRISREFPAPERTHYYQSYLASNLETVGTVCRFLSLPL